MQHAVTIRFEGLPVSDALREDILRHAHKLWQIAPQLQSCDVAVRHAVREFQREARMTTHNGQATRLSGGAPVAAASITPFAGAISGIASRKVNPLWN